MQHITATDQKRENRIFLACMVFTLIGAALRLTELAGMWGAQ